MGRNVGRTKVNQSATSAVSVQSVGRPSAGHPGLAVYKPGQGRYTRLGTVAAVAVLALFGSDFIYKRLSVIRDPNQSWTLWVQAGVPVLVMAVTALLTYLLVARSRRVNDFLIATEGEMKKVNWTTRREVIGATKVVIVVALMLALMLFVVDAVFALFFSSIGVLKIFAIRDLLGLS